MQEKKGATRRAISHTLASIIMDLHLCAETKKQQRQTHSLAQGEQEETDESGW